MLLSAWLANGEKLCCQAVIRHGATQPILSKVTDPKKIYSIFTRYSFLSVWSGFPGHIPKPCFVTSYHCHNSLWCTWYKCTGVLFILSPYEEIPAQLSSHQHKKTKHSKAKVGEKTNSPNLRHWYWAVHHLKWPGNYYSAKIITCTSGCKHSSRFSP